MKKETNPQTIKNTVIYTLSIIFIAFFTFLICTSGSLLTASQEIHARDFFTDFITGDLVITHTRNKSPGSSLLYDFSLLEKNMLSIEQYDSIERILLKNLNIHSYSPYSIYPLCFINNNRNIVDITIKYIDPQSFTQVFPEITLTHTDKSSLARINGIVLPQSLTTRINDLFKTELIEGDFLLLSSDKAELTSVREAVFSGIVSYKGYGNIFPYMAYADIKSLAGQVVTQERDEKQMNEGTTPPLPDKEAFYRNFMAKESHIQKTTLPDSYFFEFFNYNRRIHEKENPPTPAWQYIALSVGKEISVEKVKNQLNAEFSLNNLNVKIIPSAEAAVPLLSTVFISRLFLYTIIAVIFIIMFFLTFLYIKKQTSNINRKTDRNTLFPAFTKIIIRLNLGFVIASAAGVMTGVFLVPFINEAHYMPGNDIINMILAGGDTLFIIVSIPPVIVSLLLMLLLTLVINVYPLTLFLKFRPPGKKPGYQQDKDINE